MSVITISVYYYRYYYNYYNNFDYLNNTASLNKWCQNLFNLKTCLVYNLIIHCVKNFLNFVFSKLVKKKKKNRNHVGRFSVKKLGNRTLFFNQSKRLFRKVDWFKVDTNLKEIFERDSGESKGKKNLLS